MRVPELSQDYEANNEAKREGVHMGEQLQNAYDYTKYTAVAGVTALMASCGIVEGSVASLDKPSQPAVSAPKTPAALPECQGLPTVVAANTASSNAYKVIGGADCRTTVYDPQSEQPIRAITPETRFLMKCLAGSMLHVSIITVNRVAINTGVVATGSKTFDVVGPPPEC